MCQGRVLPGSVVRMMIDRSEFVLEAAASTLGLINSRKSIMVESDAK